MRWKRNIITLHLPTFRDERRHCDRIDMVSLNRPYHFRFFKGCLPQILLGPFLNNVSNSSNTECAYDFIYAAFKQKQFRYSFLRKMFKMYGWHYYYELVFVDITNSLQVPYFLKLSIYSA